MRMKVIYACLDDSILFHNPCFCTRSILRVEIINRPALLILLQECNPN